MKVLHIRKQLKDRNLNHTDAEGALRKRLVEAMIQDAGLDKNTPTSASHSDPVSNICDQGET